MPQSISPPSPMAIMGLRCGFVADGEEMGAPGGRQSQPFHSQGRAAPAPGVCTGGCSCPCPGCVGRGLQPPQQLLSTEQQEAGRMLPVEVRGFSCENTDNFSALLAACW